MTNGGSGYISAPVVVITGGNGSGATATATLTAITDSDLTAPQRASKTAFQTAIREERFRELFFEGLCKYDLIRWGELGNALKAVAADATANAPATLKYIANAGNNFTESRHVLLPIPIYELGINNLLEQNLNW